MMRRVFIFFALLATTSLIILACRLRPIAIAFDTSQFVAVIAFALIITGTLVFDTQRLAFALAGVSVLLASGLLTVPVFIRSASLDVILFLLGNFLVVGYLEERHFFAQIISEIIGRLANRPRVLLFALMAIAALLSALAGEVAASLVMTGAAIHLTSRLKINPVPLVMMLVFAINTGSAAGPFGPIGVKIAFSAGLRVGDFLRWAAPISVLCLITTAGICAVVYRRWIATYAKALANHPPVDRSNGFDLLGTAIFVLFIAMLLLHQQMEKLLGLQPDAMLIIASLLMGAIVLLLRGEAARHLVERRVDWWTLLFFMMLFAAVGALEQTGVTVLVARRLVESAHGRVGLLTQTVGWTTGLLSALLDNLLAVSTFLPIVKQIRLNAAGGYPQAVYWMMLFGGTLMGNATPIGSTSNIIACGLLEHRTNIRVRFLNWLKVGALISVCSMMVATATLAMETRGFTKPLLAKPSPPPTAAHD